VSKQKTQASIMSKDLGKNSQVQSVANGCTKFAANLHNVSFVLYFYCNGKHCNYE